MNQVDSLRQHLGYDKKTPATFATGYVVCGYNSFNNITNENCGVLWEMVLRVVW